MTSDPREEDILFRNDLPDQTNNACVNVQTIADELAYMEGYRCGASILTKHVVENQSNQDFLVYPIVFLYRHHIELTLKGILRRIPFLLKRELTNKEKNHLDKHNLDVLWSDLKPVLTETAKRAGYTPINRANIEGIDSYIQQLGEVDPYSFSFRYTSSKKGEPSLPKELKHINLRHFSELMERFSSYLYDLDMWTWHAGAKINEVHLKQVLNNYLS